MRFSISNTVYVAAIVAYVPVIVGYLRINWSKGHYQFFPLLIAVAIWLIYDRLADLKPTSDKRSNHGFGKIAEAIAAPVLLGLAALTLGFSVVVQSSFVVIPSVMLLVASWIIDRYGTDGFKQTLPAWLLLLLVIPFPWNLDSMLVNRMQFLASGLASWMLDSIGQPHFREGLTLVTEKKQFFTEEACSGIRSLFSSIAAISAFGVACRYPLWRHSFNWLQILVWVIVGNAIRIAIVVYVSDAGFEAIASGAWHDMLGIGVFGLVIGLALSTNRVFEAFDAEIEEGLEDVDESVIDVVVGNRKKQSEIVKQKYRRRDWIAISFFSMVLLFSMRLAYAQYFYRPRVFDEDALPFAMIDDLPKQIDGWKVVDFEQKIRPQTSLLAPNSYLWTFQKGEAKVLFSLDGPYRAFHDLSVCYRGLGWDLRSEYDVKPSGGPKSDSSFTRLRMRKRDQAGVVLYSAYDARGKGIRFGEAVSKGNNAGKNVKLVFGLYDPDRDSQQIALVPISQFQVLYEGASPLDESFVAELERLYLKARREILKSSRFQG